MNLRPCPCCGKQNTTRNATKLGRVEGFLYFNCSCKGTFVLGQFKPDKQKSKGVQNATTTKL